MIASQLEREVLTLIQTPLSRFLFPGFIQFLTFLYHNLNLALFFGYVHYVY